MEGQPYAIWLSLCWVVGVCLGWAICSTIRMCSWRENSRLWQEKCSTANHQAQSWYDRNLNLDSSLAEWKQKYAEAVDELEKSKFRHADEVLRHRKAAVEQCDRAVAAEGECGRQKTIAKDLYARVEDLQRRLDSVTTARIESEKRCHDLQGTVNSFQSQAKKLQTTRDELIADCLKWENRFKDATKRIESLQKYQDTWCKRYDDEVKKSALLHEAFDELVGFTKKLEDVLAGRVGRDEAFPPMTEVKTKAFTGSNATVIVGATS